MTADRESPAVTSRGKTTTPLTWAITVADPRPATQFAIFDLDGTLHPETLGRLLLKELQERGISSRERTAELFDFLRGLDADRLHEPVHVQTAYQMYARTLEGCPQHRVMQVAREVWERHAANVFPYATPLLSRLREAGVTLVLISGSPQEVVVPAAQSLGIRHSCGATLETSGGSYTGRITEAPAIPGQKTMIATRLLGGTHNLRCAMAIGNSSSDLDLLDRVGWPVAFEPDARLRTAAARQGWLITDRASILASVPVFRAPKSSVQEQYPADRSSKETGQ
ncbi:HAD-IB family phosphatase [Streptomyces sp. KS 21]|uniref:HAD family hydrolase n=1 Tax=Streptomyces sp. KS 21 TaxID=2485150 RepID=UPI001063DD78|nr:HAD-IB family phosphatase [Streptomyces sp. KS 21]